MFSTLGVILVTVAAALVSSLVTILLLKRSPAPRARRASTQDSASTSEEPAPTRWESRLRELEADQVSLSSNFEKIARELKRLNSRAGMREHRSNQAASEAPPIGTPKTELFRHYGLAGKSPRDIAAMQLAMNLDQTKQ